MGTEILRPQDILGGDHFRVSPAPFPRRKSYFQNGNGNNYNYGYQKKKINNGQFRHHHQQHQKQPEIINPEPFTSLNKSDTLNRNNNGNGVGFTLLRRGESVDSLNSKIKNNNNNSRTAATTSFSKKERNVYAGSVCSVSPSPSSLPLPTFFQKQDTVRSVDDSATRDLRRLLRLE